MDKNWVFNIYLEYLETNFPKYNNTLSEESLKKIKYLYFNVNDVFIACNFFEHDEYSTCNYANLVKEFKTYLSRVLILIPINDKYLIDALFRLLIEKLYRIIYGLHHLHLQESSIRKHERQKMSDRLEGKIIEKSGLDSLYRQYSQLIHHTNSTFTDLLNFKQLEKAEANLINYVNDFVTELKKIYIIDFFIPVLDGKELDLPSKLILHNDIQEPFKLLLKGKNII